MKKEKILKIGILVTEDDVSRTMQGTTANVNMIAKGIMVLEEMKLELLKLAEQLRSK